jgi:hypothetical protein
MFFLSKKQKFMTLYTKYDKNYVIYTMLDWYTINYLYPKSFERFSNVMFPNVGVVSLSTLEFYDTKKLYQFFDKEGVYLNVEMYNPHQWVFTISLSNGIVFGPTQDSKKNREEVECAGFVECFKIMDKIIRDKSQ